jgi:hypothetical protein
MIDDDDDDDDDDASNNSQRFAQTVSCVRVCAYVPIQHKRLV